MSRLKDILNQNKSVTKLQLSSNDDENCWRNETHALPFCSPLPPSLSVFWSDWLNTNTEYTTVYRIISLGGRTV